MTILCCTGQSVGILLLLQHPLRLVGFGFGSVSAERLWQLLYYMLPKPCCSTHPLLAIDSSFVDWYQSDLSVGVQDICEEFGHSEFRLQLTAFTCLSGPPLQFVYTGLRDGSRAGTKLTCRPLKTAGKRRQILVLYRIQQWGTDSTAQESTITNRVAIGPTMLYTLL